MNKLISFLQGMFWFFSVATVVSFLLVGNNTAIYGILALVTYAGAMSLILKQHSNDF